MEHWTWDSLVLPTAIKAQLQQVQAVIEEIGLLIHEVKILYKGQLRLVDSPLQVTMWSKRVRAVDFTIGYEVRSVRKGPDAKPAVIAAPRGTRTTAGCRVTARPRPR